MTRADQIKSQISALTAEFNAEIGALSAELLRAQIGAHVGSTLVNDHGDQFLVQSIENVESVLGAGIRFDGVMSIKTRIYADSLSLMGWRLKDEN